MRLQQYLKEKYLNTFHQDYGNEDFEVFINPSKKELRELVNQEGGFRFLIDFKNKKFYAFSSRMFHDTVISKLPNLPNWIEFWKKGVGLEYIYTGAKAGDRYESDAMIRFGAESYKYEGKLKQLSEQDWRWTGSFIDAKAVKKTVDVNIGKHHMTHWGKQTNEI